jgi:hypothetical protein
MKIILGGADTIQGIEVPYVFGVVARAQAVGRSVAVGYVKRSG